MQWLGKKVGYHHVGGAIGYGEIAGLDSVSDKIIPTVEVLGVLQAELGAILLKQNGALVVLVEKCIISLVSLHIQKEIHQ